MKVAVVGTGIAGASAARFLAARGHEVVAFDQFGCGHTRGSSHGNSRIVRRAYPDAFYTEIMMVAYPMWAELERESGRTLLHECGLLYFGSANDANLLGVLEGLRSVGVPHKVCDPAQCSQILPGLRLHADEVGVWTPQAGWVPATESVLASIELAKRAGARLEHRRIESLEELERVFDYVVLCAGAWIGRFLDLDVTVTCQTFAYVKGVHHGPVWIEEGPRYAYGFPSEPGRDTWKVGAHNVRVPVDPDSGERPVSEETLRGISEFARRRFGMDSGTPATSIAEVATCLYTLTPDEDFRFGRVGEKIVFASACSGHGFKFGPWVGKALADMVEGKPRVEEYARFWRSPRRLS